MITPEQLDKAKALAAEMTAFGAKVLPPTDERAAAVEWIIAMLDRETPARRRFYLPSGIPTFDQHDLIAAFAAGSEWRKMQEAK